MEPDSRRLKAVDTMAELDPIIPLVPIRPPGAQPRSPDRDRPEHRRRPGAPARERTDDAGGQHDSDPLVDDYA